MPSASIDQSARSLLRRDLRLAVDRQLVIDNLFKLRLRLSTAQESAIDKVCRGAGYAGLGSLLPVCFYVMPELAARKAGAKRTFIQMQILCASDQACFVQLCRIRKQIIVILPELALLPGTLRGLCRFPCLPIDLC